MKCSPKILAREAKRRAKRNADPEKLAAHKVYMKEYAINNRQKLTDLNRKIYSENKIKIRLQRKGIKAKLNLISKIESHSGLCDICSKPGDGRWSELSIDHCHGTGHFRGMLCSSCNRGLGLFQDDPVLMSKAIDYLIQYRKTLDGEFVAG